jgi:hypothetical protein
MPSALGGHEDLWVTSIPADRGPEGNLKMWEEAEEYLDYLCRKTEERDSEGGEAAHAALVDAYNRCVEERRRAEDLLKLRAAWDSRRVGGAAEPESPVKG